MRRSLWLAACVTALVAAAGSAAAAGQGFAPPPPPAPAFVRPRGLSSISVTVVSAESGRPVKGANVLAIIETADGTYTSNVLSDRQGRALILGLPRSRVRLSANHPSFVPMINGQSAPNDTNGTFINIGEGQQIDNVTLRLTRGGAISGIIVDEAGEPLVGVTVRAYRRAFTNGRQTFIAIGKAGDTDDRGMYRIPLLPPGDYLVGIAGQYLEMEAPNLDDDRTSSTFEPIPPLERMLTEGVFPAEGRILVPLRGSPLPIEGAGAPTLAYPVTFFPGTTVSAAAAVIRLGAGERRDGVSFALQPTPVTRVSGHVVEPSGEPTTRVRSLRLVPVTPNDRVSVGDTFTADISPGGVFGFSMVPPGQYTLEALGSAAPEPSQPPLARPLWASMPITVADKPISDVTLKLEEGEAFSGQVRIDGERPPGFPSLTAVRVSLVLQPVDGVEPFISLMAAVTEQGRFHVSQVIPGEYRIAVVGLPSDWRMTSAMIEGRDALDFGLRIPVHHDVDAAVITVSNKLSQLSGTVRDATGATSTRGYVIVFPSDSLYWASASWRIQGTRPDTDGQFRFRQLPPGNYLLAVADCEPGQFRDPAFLETLKSRATPVVIGAAETVTKDIRW